jgi:subtilisin family serine protease
VSDEHGTAVAGVASASANGTGIVGVWPGMRVLDSVNQLNCADLVRSVNDATGAGAAVINMSYGFGVGTCFAHVVATNYAFGKGVLPVAAGGNDFQQGNRPSSPAVDPHVLTVAAVDRQRRSAFFSSENGAIDVSAPGVDVLTTVPRAFDGDGQPDGYESLDGTSFSAPIVAAAAAWIMQARPALDNDQVAAVIRDSATDLGAHGWDQQFGYGLLKLKRALTQAPEAHDPSEPNDNIVWVDGSIFAPDPPIFEPPDTKRTVGARLDQFEDPADVYRVRVAPHAKLRFQLRPVYGDPDLEIYKGSAKTIYSAKGRLGRSTKSGLATDTVTWTNTSSQAAWIYVDTYIDAGVRQLDAAYQLSVARL